MTKQLKDSLKFGCKLLKIKKIPKLKIINIANNKSSHYSFTNNIIVINLSYKGQYVFRKSLNKANIFIIEDDIILFSLFHELGHCFQLHKYNKWYNQFKCQYEELYQMVNYTYDFTEKFENLDSEYRKIKAEHNADKIALILLKKYKEKI